ncbi:MAG: site-specific integrase [Clostridia bacterium]|nr:site-specific integrase [Clostridia bacterium]
MATKKSNTRAANGNGTIRQRADGRWEGRLTVEWDAGSGKQKQRSFYGWSQKEVAEKLRAAAVERDKGLNVKTPEKITVSSWLQTWLTTYCTTIKPNTLYTYKKQVDCRIVPALGAVKLTALRPDQVQKSVNNLTKGDDPLSPKSIKNCVAVLRSAMTRAVQNDLIRKNPCDNVELPKAKKKEIQPLDETGIAEFMKAISGHHNELIFKIALFTGMRQGELMGLKWSDIDFDKGLITIQRQLVHGKTKGTGYSMASTKTDAIRTIRPAPLVLDWLKSWQKEQSALRLRFGKQWGDNFGGLVFTDVTGQHLCHSTLTHEARRFGKAIGKPDLRFHDLRHSYAVMCIRAGDDFKTISSNLGHTTITITMDIYAAFTNDMALASSNRMTAYMQSIGVG